MQFMMRDNDGVPVTHAEGMGDNRILSRDVTRAC